MKYNYPSFITLFNIFLFSVCLNIYGAEKPKVLTIDTLKNIKTALTECNLTIETNSHQHITNTQLIEQLDKEIIIASINQKTNSIAEDRLIITIREKNNELNERKLSQKKENKIAKQEIQEERKKLTKEQNSFNRTKQYFLTQSKQIIEEKNKIQLACSNHIINLLNFTEEKANFNKEKQQFYNFLEIGSLLIFAASIMIILKYTQACSIT